MAPQLNFKKVKRIAALGLNFPLRPHVFYPCPFTRTTSSVALNDWDLAQGLQDWKPGKRVERWPRARLREKEASGVSVASRREGPLCLHYQNIRNGQSRAEPRCPSLTRSGADLPAAPGRGAALSHARANTLCARITRVPRGRDSVTAGLRRGRYAARTSARRRRRIRAAMALAGTRSEGRENRGAGGRRNGKCRRRRVPARGYHGVTLCVALRERERGCSGASSDIGTVGAGPPA
ncbi:putative protein CXorf67, partial [Ophiophagus hannah]